jgi:hypothetical protein
MQMFIFQTSIFFASVIFSFCPSFIIFIEIIIGLLNNFFTQFWIYLSVWSLARRYGIRPVIPPSSLSSLSAVFNNSYFRVPSLEKLGKRCDLMPWILDEHLHTSHIFIHNAKETIRILQPPFEKNLTLFKFGYYPNNVIDAVPFWRELKHDLVIRGDLQMQADAKLVTLRKDFFYRAVSK